MVRQVVRKQNLLDGLVAAGLAGENDQAAPGNAFAEQGRRRPRRVGT
jgi:hypothetical protein